MWAIETGTFSVDALGGDDFLDSEQCPGHLSHPGNNHVVAIGDLLIVAGE